MPDDTLTPTPPPDAASPPVVRLSHGSTVAELVPMHLKFLALTLITLGIFQFWARTYARRFLWHRTRLLGDPFTYLGRPVELLLGFAVALVLIFGPIFAINVILVTRVVSELEPGWVMLFLGLTAIQAIGIPYLVFVGGYAARRYRLSRTAWRGIRGAQSGSAWMYGLYGYLGTLAAGLTFGWYYPWHRARLARVRIDRSWFGSQHFDCDIAGRDLVSAFAILWFGIGCSIVLLPLLGVAIVGIVVGFSGFEFEMAPEQMERYAWVMQLAVLLFYAPIGLFVMIYRAHELRLVARHTSFAGGAVRFEMTHTVWQYVGYVIGNLLIMLVTLGTGWIYLRRRQITFWSRFLAIHGALDLATLQQTAEGSPRTGEGLAELFDLGFEVGF